MDTFKKNVQLFCEQSFLTDDVKREAIVCLLLDFIGGLSAADRNGMKRTEIEFVQCVEALIANKEMTVRKEFVLSAWAVSFAATFSVEDPTSSPNTEGASSMINATSTKTSQATASTSPLPNLSAQEQIRALLDGLKRDQKSAGKDWTEEKKILLESLVEENARIQPPMSFEDLNKPAKKSPKLIGQLCQDVTELYRLQHEEKDQKGESASTERNGDVRDSKLTGMIKVELDHDVTSPQSPDEKNTKEKFGPDAKMSRPNESNTVSTHDAEDRPLTRSKQAGEQEQGNQANDPEGSASSVSNTVPNPVLSCVDAMSERLNNGTGETCIKFRPSSTTGKPSPSDLRHLEHYPNEKRRAKPLRTAPINREVSSFPRKTDDATDEIGYVERPPGFGMLHERRGLSVVARDKELMSSSIHGQPERKVAQKRSSSPFQERASPRRLKVERKQNPYELMAFDEHREGAIRSIQSLTQEANIQNHVSRIMQGDAAASLAYLDQALALRDSEQNIRNVLDASSYYTYQSDPFAFGASRNQSTSIFHFPHTAAAYAASPYVGTIFPSRSEVNNFTGEAKQRSSTVKSGDSFDNMKGRKQFSSSRKEYAEYLMDWVKKRAPSVPHTFPEGQAAKTACPRNLKRTVVHLPGFVQRLGDQEDPSINLHHLSKSSAPGSPPRPVKRYSKDGKESRNKKPDKEGVKAERKAPEKKVVEKNESEKMVANGGPLPNTEPPPKQRRGRKKRPKDFPKRPLSGYNLFFKDERARILFNVGAEEEDKAQGTTNEDGAEEQHNHVGDDDDGAEAGADVTSPKRIRKGRAPPHRKIGFEKMAQTISKRWNSLSEEDKAPYLAKAKVEMKRYREETQEYFRKAKVAEEENAVDEDCRQDKQDEDSDTESEASEC